MHSPPPPLQKIPNTIASLECQSQGFTPLLFASYLVQSASEEPHMWAPWMTGWRMLRNTGAYRGYCITSSNVSFFWSSGVHGGAWCRREVASRSFLGPLTPTRIDAGMDALDMLVQETRPSESESHVLGRWLLLLSNAFCKGQSSARLEVLLAHSLLGTCAMF